MRFRNIKFRIWQLFALLTVIALLLFCWDVATRRTIVVKVHSPGKFIYRNGYEENIVGAGVKITDKDFYVAADFIDAESGEHICSGILFGSYGRNGFLGNNVTQSSLETLDNYTTSLTYRTDWSFSDTSLDRTGAVYRAIHQSGLSTQGLSPERVQTAWQLQDLNLPPLPPCTENFALCGVKLTHDEGESFVIMHVINTKILGKRFFLMRAGSGDGWCLSQPKPPASWVKEKTGFLPARGGQLDQWQPSAL